MKNLNSLLPSLEDVLRREPREHAVGVEHVAVVRHGDLAPEVDERGGLVHGVALGGVLAEGERGEERRGVANRQQLV